MDAIKDFALWEFGILEHRIFFLRRWPQERHVERLYLGDLGLDTIFYNGHTTNCDALWSGLPVITMTGVTWASRVTESLYNGLGIHEQVKGWLVTDSL